MIKHTHCFKTAGYLKALRTIDIDQKVSRFGYDELVVSLELGFPGDEIADPDKWARSSLQHLQDIAPYMTLT